MQLPARIDNWRDVDAYEKAMASCTCDVDADDRGYRRITNSNCPLHGEESEAEFLERKPDAVF